jgi:MFS transporter, DHA1 family, tetracycline resistance protein
MSALVDGPKKAALSFIFITVLLDVLALGVVIPVLPKLIEQMVGGDPAQAAVTFSWFVSSWEGMQFLFSPILGALSDRVGRRPVVLASNLGLGLDYMLMAVAQTLPLLFVGRVISGITSATFSVAGAYIADVTPEEKRAEGFGMLGAAFGIGFVVGPALGGVLGNVSPRLPFFVAGGLSLANALYGFFVLPESLPKEKRAPFAWHSLNPFLAFSILFRTRTLKVLGLSALLSSVAHFVYQSTYVYYVSHRFGWSPRSVGLSLAIVGVCAAVVQGGLVGPVMKRLGAQKTLLFGLCAGVVGFATFGVATSSAVFLAGILLNAFWGLAGPAAQGIMSSEVDPKEQGQLQGATGALMAFTGIFSPTLFSRTYAWSLGQSTWFWGAPFYLSSLLLVLALATVLFRPHAKTASVDTR